MLIFIDDVRAALANIQSPIFEPLQGTKSQHDDCDAEKGASELKLHWKGGDQIQTFGQTMSPSQSEVKTLIPSLLGILANMVQEERAGVKRVGVDFIVHTHFDMLLAEIPKRSTDFHNEMKNVVVQAGILEGLWKSRLGVNWRLISAQRIREAKATGPRRELGSIIFPPDWRIGHEIGWVVGNVAHGAEAAGGLGFPAGQ